MVQTTDEGQREAIYPHMRPACSSLLPPCQDRYRAQQEVAGSHWVEDDDESGEIERLAGLVHIEIGRKHKRPMCSGCGRPQSVCWCRTSSITLHQVQSSVVVLQHPHEEKRCLRTAPMLEGALPRCRVVKGKKFNLTTVPELSASNTIVLYPARDATEVSTLPPVSQAGPYTIVVLDGTWYQARAMMHKSRDLRNVKKVIVRSAVVSQYVIRTQPSDTALSTVESAALALAALEGDQSIYHTLVEPLGTLCRHQLSHGAVIHHSKESRYKKAPEKVMGKRTAKTLAQCGAVSAALAETDNTGSSATRSGNTSTAISPGSGDTSTAISPGSGNTSTAISPGSGNTSTAISPGSGDTSTAISPSSGDTSTAISPGSGDTSTAISPCTGDTNVSSNRTKMLTTTYETETVSHINPIGTLGESHRENNKRGKSTCCSARKCAGREADQKSSSAIENR